MKLIRQNSFASVLLRFDRVQGRYEVEGFLDTCDEMTELLINGILQP